MNENKKVYLTLTFLVGLAGVILMVVGFATENWIISHPVKNHTATNDNATQIDGRFTGTITLGLFKGHSTLNHGFGDRHKDVYMKELNDLGISNFALWVATIVTLSLGIVWGMIAMGFSVYNIFGKPIETITGEMGLYLWNGLAWTFSLLAVLVYMGLFFNNLQVNLLPKEDVDNGWMSENRTYLDQSFYYLVGASGAFLINILILLLSGQKCCCSYSRAGEKEIDNGMILY